MGPGNWVQRMTERKDVWTINRDCATAVMVMLFAEMGNSRGRMLWGL